MSGPPEILPHPECEILTADQIRFEIGETEEKLKLARELGDDEKVAWFTGELRAEQAALAKRLGTPTPIEGAAARTPIIVKISDIRREEVTWLWQDRIPIGKLTMIEGDPGLGKSWLTMAIASAVSRGDPLPGDRARTAEVVLLMTAEDGLGDTIRPRLEDMGANLEHVRAIKGMINARGQVDVLTLADLDSLEIALTEHKPRLVIIDPIIAFTAGKDTSKANEVRGLLSPLAGLAEKHGCAILAVRHLNKSAAKAFYRGQGSIDFVAACRSAFVVGEHPDEPEDRVLCHLKSNLAKKTPALVFNIKNGIFGWKGESDLTAEQVLATPSTDDERTLQDDCKGFLIDLLSSTGVGAGEVFKQGKAAGFSDITIRRTQREIGIKPRRVGGLGRSGQWLWELPETLRFSKVIKDSMSLGDDHLSKNDHLSDISQRWEPVD